VRIFKFLIVFAVKICKQCLQLFQLSLDDSLSQGCSHGLHRGTSVSRPSGLQRDHWSYCLPTLANKRDY